MKPFKRSIIQGVNNKNCTTSVWFKFNNNIKNAWIRKRKAAIRFSERPLFACYTEYWLHNSCQTFEKPFLCHSLLEAPLHFYGHHISVVDASLKEEFMR